MDSVLGRKQRIKNSDWIEIFDKIEQLITKKELDQLVDKTIQDIKAKTKGKKAAYAWSGGKDSLVLGEICRRAGISSCVLVISNLEYKAFTQWVEDNKPPELSIINTGQDIKWLVTHPHMLFPQDSKYAAQWFHIVQHRGQAKYYKENNLDMLLLGRRRADGNYVGNLLYQGEFEYLQIIVDFCIEPRSVQEIMDKFGLDSRTSFRRKYLTPMLEKDVLKMTIPEKPSSKN